jgi:NAD(P)-dependent dehydrogenase (short-subunit alcohol dehydrogenase family)
MERILITGANRGVGFALVKQYIASGDVQIFATCRTPERATELNALADQHAGEIIVVPLDINDEASIEASVKLVEQQTSALDVVINNAGIYPKGAHQSSSLGQLSLADVAEVVNTNSVSPLIVSQAYRHLLKQGNTPRLVMISSQMGSLNLAGSGAYAYRMSKASMNMAAVTLSQDSQMSGVIVVTTHPGWVQTDMGGAGASITPTESASGLKALIDGLTASDNGKFYRWDGSEHAW